jgi:hypothetical protein
LADFNGLSIKIARFSNLMEGLAVDDEARNSLRIVGHDVGRSLFLAESVFKVKRESVSGKRHEWSFSGKWFCIQT